MWRKWVMLLCLLVIVAGLVMCLVEKASAAGGGLDDLGMDGAGEKAKQVLTSERPTKLKIAIGVGSVVVAILVLKFL